MNPRRCKYCPVEIELPIDSYAADCHLKESARLIRLALYALTATDKQLRAWVLGEKISPEIAELLAHRCEWSPDSFEALLRGASAELSDLLSLKLQRHEIIPRDDEFGF